MPPRANSPGALAGRGRSSIRCARRSPAPAPSPSLPPRNPQGPWPPPYSPARSEQVSAPRQRLRAGPGREGGGSRGGRGGGGGRARSLPVCAAAQIPAGGHRLRAGARGGGALAVARRPRLPRGEAVREARHRYAREKGTARGGGRPRARGGEGRPRRASLTSRPGRRTRGEGTAAHACPRRSRPSWAAWPPGYRRRSARSGLARPSGVCGQGQEQGV